MAEAISTPGCVSWA